jgi:hypothetical protein
MNERRNALFLWRLNDGLTGCALKLTYIILTLPSGSPAKGEGKPIVHAIPTSIVELTLDWVR